MKKISTVSKFIHHFLSFLTAGAGLITFFTLFAKHFWIFDLFTHYAPYYFALGLLLLLVLFLKKRFLTALILIPFIAIQLLQIAPYFSPPPSSLTTTENLKILASNVYLSTPHFDDLYEIILEEDPDIFVIHEASSLWEKELLRYEETYPYQFRNRPGVKGMVIASKIPGTSEEFTLANVPSLVFNSTSASPTMPLFQVIAVHPPAPIHKSFTAERDAYLEELANKISSTQNSTPTIIIGDFNISPFSPHFQNFIESTSYSDARLGFGLVPTWNSDWPWLNIAIDHALISPKITVNNFYTTERIQSDHYPIVVELEI
jgi:endonuclease/exonuclease/phosphatase (EEP) superfamily protein YafD